MNYIKAKFIKSDKPSGRAYTYRCEEDVKAGDMVTDSKGSKLVVVDEAVDMEWIRSYGAEKVAVVKQVESETYDSAAADAAQKKYCKDKVCPHFAPSTICPRCDQDIYAKEGMNRYGKIRKGISVERAGKELITGCPFCNWSYCE